MLLLRDRFQPGLDHMKELKTPLGWCLYWPDPDTPESLASPQILQSRVLWSSRLRQPSGFRREFSRMPLTKPSDTSFGWATTALCFLNGSHHGNRGGSCPPPASPWPRYSDFRAGFLSSCPYCSAKPVSDVTSSLLPTAIY